MGAFSRATGYWLNVRISIPSKGFFVSPQISDWLCDISTLLSI
jgi:hypothetical protein